MITNDETIRCCGCGKSIDAGPDGKTVASGAKVVRIAVGRFKANFTEQKEWGYLHESCFNRSIDSPDAVMDEVRKQASARRVA